MGDQVIILVIFIVLLLSKLLKTHWQIGLVELILPISCYSYNEADKTIQGKYLIKVLQSFSLAQ